MRQSPEDLVEHLRDQVVFLRVSGAAFDEGVEAEAKRLAVTIRVLVHDTGSSHSLLKQLGVKDQLRFVNTQPGDPEGVPGLARAVWNGDVWRWAAPLADWMRGKPLAFSAWWETAVIVDRKTSVFDRRGLVLPLAHKEGGAHVDPDLDEAYAALSRLNSLGWHMRQDPTAGPGEMQPARSPVPANVRQIAWEVQKTIEEQLSQLL